MKETVGKKERARGVGLSVYSVRFGIHIGTSGSNTV